jgi:hypothetical protein
MRCSNPTVPTALTLRPKLRSRPRMSFSIRNSLFLKELARIEQRTSERLYMHRPK